MTLQNEAINTTNSMIDGVKQAFAPMTDAIKKMEVPAAARDFVKRAATTAKDRATDLHTGSEKVTAAIETAVSGSVSEAAKISRNIQEAMYQDVQAFFSGIEQLAGAQSLTDAFQIQSDLVRSRGEVMVGRAKSTTDYLSKLVADGTRTAQDNFSKVATYGKTA